VSKLVLFLADGTTLDVPLKRERMTIGRRADNDICLPNLAVSGEHAAVVTISPDSFLEDLGSTNGTLVNGAPIAKHLLRDGDQIDVGRHVLVYCVDEDAVLTADIVRGSARSAAGDLGEPVEAAKPFLKSARGPSGGAMRRERASANAAAKRALAQVPALERTQANVVHKAARASPRTASLKVLSGPSAGHAIPITKVRTTLGRAGVQVAMLIRTGDTFALTAVEGDRLPVVNGAAMTGSEAVLVAGDVIEIMGARLEFVAAPKGGPA
jgi:predicted component of type VI protein secretion system